MLIYTVGFAALAAVSGALGFDGRLSGPAAVICIVVCAFSLVGVFLTAFASLARPIGRG